MSVGPPNASAATERRRRWVEAAFGLSASVQGRVPPEATWEKVARLARTVSGAAAAAVVTLPHDAAPVVLARDGADHLLTDEALAAAVAACHDHEAAPDPRYLLARTHSLTGPVGVLLVGPSDGGSDEERLLLGAYADMAGLAVERAQAVLARQELAVARGREQIARELHDQVIQRLFAAGLLLQTARSDETEVTATRIDEVVDALDVVIRNIRDTVLELRPE